MKPNFKTLVAIPLFGALLVTSSISAQAGSVGDKAAKGAAIGATVGLITGNGVVNGAVGGAAVGATVGVIQKNN